MADLLLPKASGVRMVLPSARALHLALAVAHVERLVVLGAVAKVFVPAVPIAIVQNSPDAEPFENCRGLIKSLEPRSVVVVEQGHVSDVEPMEKADLPWIQ